MTKKLTKKQKGLYSKLTTLQKHCANFYISGKTLEQSYRLACKKMKRKPSKNPRAAGQQIITKAAVQAYIDAVRVPEEEKAAVSAIMDREEILEGFTREARGSIAYLMEFEEGIVGETLEGEPITGMMLKFKNSDKLSEVDLSLISEISVSEKGAIKIKLCDKQNARKQINLMQGYEAANKLQLVDDDEQLTPWGDVKAGVDE